MKHRVLARFGLAWLLFLGAPSALTAGDCPVCTSSGDCPMGSFCVRHTSPVGCGDRVMLCCPGQACAVVNGRPSCEARGTCAVVNGPADAGASDVATVADVPVPPTDSPVTPTDSPVAATDGAVTAADGGTITNATAGCGCRTDAPSKASGAGLLSLLALATIGRRRRTR